MSGERARLFAALDLPDGVRDALAAWAGEHAGGREELRLVAEESLHVTLCFLGGRPVEEVVRVGAAVSRCAGPAPRLAVGEAAWLPRRRPRVLAIDLEDRDGDLARLQARVSAALAREAGYEPERRAYRPHVTVARVRSGARIRASGLPPPARAEFAGAALTLYRSFPRRGGARYEAISRVQLKG